jgi:outer membrane protein assembly factor BamB
MKNFILDERLRCLLSIALMGLVAPVPRADAADFPQWRGPQRDGHSPETGLLQEWPEGGPKLLWQVNHVGAGYSTPSVVGGRIYLLGNEGIETESLIALAAKDGGIVWSATLGKVGHPKQDPNYPGARSTPTVDGRFVFALGSDGDVVCLEAENGKEVWRRHLRHDFGGKHGEWAYSESPLVDGDRLICTPGGTNATMVALNKRTGELIWKCAVPGGSDASYASAVRAEFSGVKQYVQFLATGLAGVDAENGTLLWHFAKTAKGSPAVIITPLVSDGMIYSGAFRANCALIKPVLKDGAFAVEEIYSNNKLPIGLGGVVKAGDYLYGSSSQSAMCVEFKTGALKWEERAIGPCSWLVADGRIYLHAESGDVALIEPSGEGYRERGRFSPSNPPPRGQAKAWAYPVVANGRLYIREQNLLWCYDVKAAK